MAERSSTPFEEIDHTADLALRIYGANLNELFLHAAQAMFAYYGLADLGHAAPQTHTLHIEGPDAETMLVDWLNELLYLAEVHEIVFKTFCIQQLTPTSLEAQAQGYPLEKVCKAIKAATFYDLKIETGAAGSSAAGYNTAGYSAAGYSAVITFDV